MTRQSDWLEEGKRAASRQNWRDSAACFDQAIILDSNRADVLAIATEVYRRSRLFEKALSVSERACAARPRLCSAFCNRALVLQDLGRHSEAESHFREAIEIEPRYRLAHINLGKFLLVNERVSDAVAELKSALRLIPGDAEVLGTLGQAWLVLGSYAKAVAVLRRAHRANPKSPTILLNLGNALAKAGELAEAERLLRNAVDLRDDYVAAWHDLGVLYEGSNRIEHARACYQKAFDLNPDRSASLASLVNAQRRLCDWTDWQSRVDRLLQETRRDIAIEKRPALWPLASCRLPTTPEDQLGIARLHARDIARRVTPLPPRPEPRRLTSTGERIVIGFLSHELGDTVVGNLIQGLFERFDRRRFRILALDYSLAVDSTIRRRILTNCDGVIDLRRLSASNSAAAIRRAGVDILVDISPYMNEGRPEIAAFKPAPVQVTYLYPATTGAPWIDYFITDTVMTPPEFEMHFTERLILLPPSYLPTNCDREIAGPAPSRSHFGLPEDEFVFASFNSADKIDPGTFDLWMRILRAVPRSILWQKENGPTVAINLRRVAANLGVDPQRILFAPSEPDMATHLSRHRCADLFLDTLIHGAHATAADILMSGSLLLTCPGRSFASRVGSSLLTSLGLEELVATAPLSYEKKAIHLASDAGCRSDLRRTLNRNIGSTPLGDTWLLATYLEAAFATMWRHYLARRAPTTHRFKLAVKNTPSTS